MFLSLIFVVFLFLVVQGFVRVIVFFWGDVVPYLPHGIIPYLIGGGVTYSIGVLFYAMKGLPHYHAIWHMFVLAGSIWFYVGIYGHVL